MVPEQGPSPRDEAIPSKARGDLLAEEGAVGFLKLRETMLPLNDEGARRIDWVPA